MCYIIDNNDLDLVIELPLYENTYDGDKMALIDICNLRSIASNAKLKIIEIKIDKVIFQFLVISIIIDSNEHLYISDGGGRYLRKVDFERLTNAAFDVELYDLDLILTNYKQCDKQIKASDTDPLNTSTVRGIRGIDSQVLNTQNISIQDSVYNDTVRTFNPKEDSVMSTVRRLTAYLSLCPFAKMPLANGPEIKLSQRRELECITWTGNACTIQASSNHLTFTDSARDSMVLIEYNNFEDLNKKLEKVGIELK